MPKEKEKKLHTFRVQGDSFFPRVSSADIHTGFFFCKSIDFRNSLTLSPLTRPFIGRSNNCAGSQKVVSIGELFQQANSVPTIRFYRVRAATEIIDNCWLTARFVRPTLKQFKQYTFTRTRFRRDKNTINDIFSASICKRLSLWFDFIARTAVNRTLFDSRRTGGS